MQEQQFVEIFKWRSSLLGNFSAVQTCSSLLLSQIISPRNGSDNTLWTVVQFTEVGEFPRRPKQVSILSREEGNAFLRFSSHASNRPFCHITFTH